MAIARILPDPGTFLVMTPEEVGGVLLRVVRERREAMFNIRSENTFIYGGDAQRREMPVYDRRHVEVDAIVREGWEWLRNAGLIMPAEGTNGQNGWTNLTRAGSALRSDEDFASYRNAAKFPKEMLHPSIADRVWALLSRGEFSDAVFTAFRTVEERVRGAGGFPDTEVGTELIRKAFHKENGPLTDLSQNLAEREALGHLFAGAIGSYKNPHSHRTVVIRDAKEAQEIVVLASHLLRIVDAREEMILARGAA